MKDVAVYLVQAGWRYALTAAFGASWMHWGSWEDRPLMRPVMLFFALVLSAAVGLAIAGDTHERSETKRRLNEAMKSNGKLVDVICRLRRMTPPGGTPVVPQRPSMGNEPVPRRDLAEFATLDRFRVKRFTRPPATARVVSS